LYDLFVSYSFVIKVSLTGWFIKGIFLPVFCAICIFFFGIYKYAKKSRPQLLHKVEIYTFLAK